MRFDGGDAENWLEGILVKIEYAASKAGSSNFQALWGGKMTTRRARTTCYFTPPAVMATFRLCLCLLNNTKGNCKGKDEEDEEVEENKKEKGGKILL